MLNISGLQEGGDLDHNQAGKSLDIYYHLGLDRLTDCQVAIIKNARSNKMGRKDIIKVEGPIDNIDLDVLGYIDHNITVNVIRDNKITEKKALKLPKKITNAARTRAASPPLSRSCRTSSIWQMRRPRLTAACTARRNTESPNKFFFEMSKEYGLSDWGHTPFCV